MTSSHPDAVAEALLRARRAHQPADALAAGLGLATPEDAYRVQANVAQALGEPAMARHWKSGGPSRHAPLTHAPLPAAGVWASPADASGWPFNQRFIEAEVALRLARDVSPEHAAALANDAAPELVDAMAVSIEIVDFRWAQGPDAPPLLKLADLQSHGALVLGAWVPYAPRDWSRQRCRVWIGSRASDHTGTHSLGDPAWLLPGWLRHATRGGATVPAGTVVTTGTWCGLLRAATGDLVRAEFDGIGAAEVLL